MVSQLSARLLASRINISSSSKAPSGYTSSGSDNSSKCASSGHCQHAPASSSMGGSSGYAADYSASPALPDSINFHEQGKESSSGTKRAHMVSSSSSSSSTLQPALKRLRTTNTAAEMDYMALNAKMDIERGGLSYPKLQPHRPRMFPPKSGVNMSTVSVLSAKHCVSPFLMDHKNISNTKNTSGLFNHYMESPYELVSLLDATASFYKLSPEKDELPATFLDIVRQMQCVSPPPACSEQERESSANSSDSESSTSSFTVSDTGHQKGVHHLSDGDSAHAKSCSDMTKESLPKKAPTDIISIGEALSICRRPRVITLSKAPYNVVQVNAAFLRLTHSKSTADYLGKPLQDLLLNETLPQALQLCGASMQKTSIPGSSHPFLRASGHRIISRISLTPVGTVAEETKKITHFAIKFCEPRSSASISSSISTASSERSLREGPINVMG
jgi:hypothetical protein